MDLSHSIFTGSTTTTIIIIIIIFYLGITECDKIIKNKQRIKNKNSDYVRQATEEWQWERAETSSNVLY